jgi:hypothetical protein
MAGEKTLFMWSTCDSYIILSCLWYNMLFRDRPFNLQGRAMFFFPFRNIFFGQHES